MSKAYFMSRDLKYGLKPKLGTQDKFYKSMYSSMFKSTQSASNRVEDMYGGIFNLEFSPNSSILIAACEKKTFILWDPITLREIQIVENAHTDCVNCIKFLNNNTFATCSDDTTIALWDVRNLKKKIRSLCGHSNWVKNVEYDPEEKLLVSSGFDGSIYSWDLNLYKENIPIYKRVFETSGLMRCRLSPDSSKLIMCTTGGYLIIIHDLDLHKLAQDLEGFKPNIYRLMQMGRQHIPVAARYKHLFSKSRSRNRLELVSDFPNGNDAEVISSLQIHPHGWCSVSRNINYDESSEWTCVHDIQTLEDNKQNGKSVCDNDKCTRLSYNDSEANDDNPAPDRNQQYDSSSSDLWEAVLTIRDQHTRRINSVNRNTNPQRQFMHYIARISSGLVPRDPQEDEHDSSDDLSVPVPSTSNSTISQPLVRSVPNSSTDPPPELSLTDISQRESWYYDNAPRLVRFISEANIGKGFIKESSFSSDGRIICSPFGYGIRLLGFDKECHELSMVNNSLEEPTELVQICHINCHKNVVVSTKFSPRHCLLVSGCLNGQVIGHNPII